MVNTSQSVQKNEEAQPTQTSGWHPFEVLHREVDKLFEEFGRSGLFQLPTPRLAADDTLFRTVPGWGNPAVDVTEDDTSYRIDVELPGLDDKHVEVALRNGRLIISGEKREEKEQKSKGYYLHERQFGSFERSFAVPEDVEVEKIDAKFSKGVLSLTLPKTADATHPPKKIAIKAV